MNRQLKFIAIGALLGIIVGTIGIFIFPQLLNFDLTTNILYRQRLGYPTDFYSPTSGGIFTISQIPVLFGVFSGLIGLTTEKLWKK